jgi:hypothetical protein
MALQQRGKKERGDRHAKDERQTNKEQWKRHAGDARSHAQRKREEKGGEMNTGKTGKKHSE